MNTIKMRLNQNISTMALLKKLKTVPMISPE